MLVIFILNIVLVLFDTSFGYFLAPLYSRRDARDAEDEARTTRGMRALLPVVVALYIFFNCFAFYRRSAAILLAVTGIIILDMIGQLLVRRKLRKNIHN